jgi:Domain of unknown function (DUF4189)
MSVRSALRVSLLLGVSIAIMTNCSDANAHGAIAIGEPEAVVVTYNHPTPEVARKQALDTCAKSGRNCRIVRDLDDTCVWVAQHQRTRKFSMRYYAYSDPYRYGRGQGEISNECKQGDWEAPCQLWFYCDSARETAEAIQKKVNEENKKRAAVDREKFRIAFMDRHRVEAVVHQDVLRANPFPYKDKIVAVPSHFQQMLAADEAQFSGIIVTGVPSVLFTRQNMAAVIAVRISGMRKAKTAFQEVSLPVGVFVGAHLCRDEGCRDFFD